MVGAEGAAGRPGIQKGGRWLIRALIPNRRMSDSRLAGADSRIGDCVIQAGKRWSLPWDRPSRCATTTLLINCGAWLGRQTGVSGRHRIRAASEQAPGENPVGAGKSSLV